MEQISGVLERVEEMNAIAIENLKKIKKKIRKMKKMDRNEIIIRLNGK